MFAKHVRPCFIAIWTKVNGCTFCIIRFYIWSHNFGSLTLNKNPEKFSIKLLVLKSEILSLELAYVLVISLNSGLTNVSVNWNGYLGSFWVHSESVVNKDKSRILLSKKRGELLEIGVGQLQLFCPSFFEEFDSKVSTTNHCQ